MRRRVLWLLSLGFLFLAARTGAGPALPFIDDDWPRAQAEARQRQVPVFVEAWAPW